MRGNFSFGTQSARGERALLDDHGNPLLVNDLSPTEIMFAILRWSALPGCSRHHWGTDIDVYDANTQSPGEVKLVSSECEDNGLQQLFMNGLIL